MYRIFIVEDDEIIANLLKKNLCSWGYDVSCAEDFSNIIQEFAHRDPQLVLLDLKLPFYNGFHWCEEIRRISQVPIIFISSASDNMNMVMAMSRGADDFIAKPFDLDVLTAKIQAILRRTYSFGTPGNVLEHKGAVLNPSRCTLTWNGHDIDLTKNELRILEILLEHAGKAASGLSPGGAGMESRNRYSDAGNQRLQALQLEPGTLSGAAGSESKGAEGLRQAADSHVPALCLSGRRLRGSGL